MLTWPSGEGATIGRPGTVEATVKLKTDSAKTACVAGQAVIAFGSPERLTELASRAIVCRRTIRSIEPMESQTIHRKETK
jgi:hypothetical protein